MTSSNILSLASIKKWMVLANSSGHFLKNRRLEEQPTADPLAHGYPQYLYDIFSLSNNVIDLLVK
jgi:hypothetical protein